MADLKTSYLGLELKNPVIAGSSGQTNTVEKIKALEKYGAGAVVLKSLFEEQINFEAGSTIVKSGASYPEAEDYIRNYSKNNSVDKYLELVEQAKNAVGIPVIASINCVSAQDWIDFTKKIELAGADALELNINIVPVDINTTPEQYENQYYEIAEKVKKTTKLPVAVKISNQFTNLSYVANRMRIFGVDALVLFNRLYEPDIDVEKLNLKSAAPLSKPDDIRHSLRWMAILSAKAKEIELSASTGIHDAGAAIKQLLAGAQTVQVCSVLYKNGPGYIGDIVKGIEKYMDKQKYADLKSMRGKMNYKSISNPGMYERSQFMRYFSDME